MKNLLYFLVASLFVPAFGVDLEQALNDALDHDPVIAQADAQRRLGKQQVPQAVGQLLPSVSMSRSRSESEFTPADQVVVDPDTGESIVIPGVTRESDGKSWGFSLSQTVFNAGTFLGLRAAQLESQRADEIYRNDLQNFYFRVAEAYMNVLRAQAQVESSDAAEQAVKRQLEQAQQRFEVGLVAVTDVLDATASYDNAIVDQIQAHSTHDIVFEVLGTLTGVQYSELARLGADMPIVNPDRTEAEWVRLAQVNNPQVEAARLGLGVQKKLRSATLSQHLPTVGASWNRSYSEGRFDALGDNESTSVSLGFSLSLFNARQLLNSRSSYIQVESAKQGLINQQLTAARNVRNLYRTVVTDVVRVEARRKAVASSSAALEATETGYQVGTRDIVDVLIAQRALFNAQNGYAASRYDYVLNRLRLMQAAGSLSEKDLQEVNQYMTSEDPVVRLAGN